MENDGIQFVVFDTKPAVPWRISPLISPLISHGAARAGQRHRGERRWFGWQDLQGRVKSIQQLQDDGKMVK
jgi:hypothetical protein